MSSILDALRKLEAAEARPASEAAAWSARPSRKRWSAAGLLVAFVAGVGLTLWLRSGSPPAALPPAPVVSAVEPVSVRPAPAREPGPAAAPPQPAVAPAAPTSPPPQVASAPPSAPSPAAPPPALPVAPAPQPVPAPAVPAPAAPAPAAAAPAVPPPPAPEALRPAAPAPPLPADVVQGAPPQGWVGTPPPTTQLAAREPAEAANPAAAADSVLPRPPAGAPHIQVSFLVYSANPARRTVAFTVDGGSLITLHEGESSHGIEIRRILADRVELRQGTGQAFTVRAGQ